MPINLLPTELAPGRPLARLAKALKNIAVAGIIVFLISVAGLIAFFIFLSTQLNSAIARQEQLKTEIKSLEQTEQRLVLVRDRLKHTREILASGNATENLEHLEGIFLGLPESVQVSEMQVFEDKVELAISASSSFGISQILAGLLGGQVYERVVLVSLSFNPTIGYLVNLELSNP